MNKLIILAVVLVCINLVSAVEESGGTIIGDSVVYDSVYATLTVTPHTAYSPVGDFRQSFTVDSKFSGDLCTAYVFNSPLQHRGISLEQNTSYYVSVDDWGDVERSMMVYNVSSIDVTSSPCEVGSGTNTHKRIITRNTLNGSIQTVYCFNSHTQVDDSTYSITYNDHDVTGSHLETRYRMQFNSVNSHFSHHTILSKEVYAHHTPLHFNAYTSRTWEIDYRPLNLAYGKYDLWLWNSLTGDCIADLNNGDYTFRYKLDPWWNSSYPYRYHIDNSAGLSTAYAYVVNDTYGLGGTFIHTLIANNSYVYSTLSDVSGILAIANETNERPWFNSTDCLGYTPSKVYDTAVGVWCFDANSGNTTIDCSGEGNTGTCYNMGGGSGITDCNWNSTAKFGHSITFDGTNDYIDAGNSSTYNVQGEFEIEVSLKPTDVSGWEGLIDKGYPDGITLAKSDAKIYFNVRQSGGYTSAYVDAVFIAGEWAYITFSRDANNNYEIRKNGTNISFTYSTHNTGNIVYSGDSLIFGKTSISGLNYYHGIMDESRINNRSLSVEERQERYQNGINNRTSLSTEESSITPPVCSCTQSPADLNFSFIGTNVTYFCNCSGAKLNHSSFMWLHSLESYGDVNWSFRPPVNIMSDVERRACNRYNKSVYPEYASWYEYITDLPQFTGNIYEWGVHDYLSAKVTLVASDSNWSNYSTTVLFEHLFSSEWDLNRIFLQSEDKSSQYKSIYTDHLGAKKFTKGSTRDNATYSCHINLESQNSLKYTSVYYCNESLVLLHEPDPASKDYCHFINSFLVSDYTYSMRNSSYVDDFQFKVNDSGFINGIEAGSTYYILVSLKENTFSKATKWHYADTPNITGDGVGFDNINRSFYSVDNGDSWVTGNYSFDIVCRYAHPDNDTLKWFVYLCNNDSICWNSSVTTDILGQFENSPPNVQILSPVVDEIISGLHNISWTANDPDSDPMSFSGVLYHSNGSYNSTLFDNISGYFFSWNSSQVDDGYWSINVTASDPYSNSSFSSGLFIVDNIPGFDIHFWAFDVFGSPISNVGLNVRNSSNSSLWSNLTNSGGFALYPTNDLVAHYIYVVYPSPGYSAVLSNVSGDSTVYINDWVSGRVRLSNTLGALLEDQDCSVVVYESTSSVLVHDYATQCHAGSSFVNRHGDWVSISNCSLTDSGGWYFFKGRVDESMGFEYDKNYDLVFTCNGESANFSFITSFEKTPLDMRKTEDFIRNYGGLLIIYGFFGFLCLLVLIIIIFVLLMRKS